MEETLKFWTDTEVYRITYKFFKAKKNDIIIQSQIAKQWKFEYFNKQMDAIDKVNRLDKISFKRINKIIEFILNDEFWNRNVHSLTYLRKKNKDKVNYCYFFLNKVGWEINTKKVEMNLAPPVSKNIVKTEKENEDKPIIKDKEEIEVDDIMWKWKTRTDLLALQKLNEQ